MIIDQLLARVEEGQEGHGALGAARARDAARAARGVLAARGVDGLRLPAELLHRASGRGGAEGPDDLAADAGLSRQQQREQRAQEHRPGG